MTIITKGMYIIEKLKNKDTQLKLIKVFLLGVYLPLGTFVALITPENIMEYKWAQAYTNFMANWIPYIAEVGQWTTIPATQFIAAVMNLVAMLCSISVIYTSKHFLAESIRWFYEIPRKKLLITLSGIPFGILGFFFLLFCVPINYPPTRSDRVMLDSMLGMGLVGSLHIISGWLLLAAGVVIAIPFFSLLVRHLVTKRR